MRMIKLWLILIALLLITACSATKEFISGLGQSDDHAEPPAPLVLIEDGIKIKELWSRDTGKGYSDKYLKLTPVIAQQRIYITDSHGNLSSINAETGKVIWEKDIDENISGGPGVGKTLVMVGSDTGEVLVFSLADGEEKWRAKVSSEILSAPQEANDVVVVRTVDGKIHGLNVANGNRLWIYDRTVPPLTLRGTSNPVIIGDVVIAGFDDGRLVAIELRTGELLWETRITLPSGRSELERISDIDSDPVIIDNRIYVATFQGQLASVSLESGDILWLKDISSYAGLATDEDTLYVSDESSHIWAFDRSSGESIWRQEQLSARKITAPASIDDFLVVGDFESYLHWIDKTSGRFVAQTEVSGGNFIAPPISVGNVVYAYSSDGTLAAYTPQ